MGRRTYTADEQAQALAIYDTDGAAAASRETGIPAATIRSWASRTGRAATLQHNREAHVQALKAEWAERRAVMVHEIGAVAHMALAQTEVAASVGRARDAKDFATTMAILVDKAQLLSGAATGRHEVIDPRRQVAQRRDELAERRVQRGAA